MFLHSSTGHFLVDIENLTRFISLSAKEPSTTSCGLGDVECKVRLAHTTLGAPDLPTTLGAGIQNSDYNCGVGMLVHAKIPGDIVSGLHQNTAQALRSPVVKEGIAKPGTELKLMTPEQFDERVRVGIAANTALVKAAGIAVN